MDISTLIIAIGAYFIFIFVKIGLESEKTRDKIRDIERKLKEMEGKDHD